MQCDECKLIGFDPEEICPECGFCFECCRCEVLDSADAEEENSPLALPYDPTGLEADEDDPQN